LGETLVPINEILKFKKKRYLKSADFIKIIFWSNIQGNIKDGKNSYLPFVFMAVSTPDRNVKFSMEIDHKFS
jgi:hypothetical protein